MIVDNLHDIKKFHQHAFRKFYCQMCGKEKFTNDGRVVYCSRECAKKYNATLNESYRKKKGWRKYGGDA